MRKMHWNWKIKGHFRREDLYGYFINYSLKGSKGLSLLHSLIRGPFIHIVCTCKISSPQSLGIMHFSAFTLEVILAWLIFHFDEVILRTSSMHLAKMIHCSFWEYYPSTTQWAYGWAKCQYLCSYFVRLRWILLLKWLLRD